LSSLQSIEAEQSGRLLHPAAGRSFLGAHELLAIAEGLAVSAQGWPGMDRPSRRVWDVMVASDTFEAWVIAWPRGGAIELHDHGGSSGALVVASGELVETTVTERANGRAETETTVLPVGTSTTFEAPHVHDLVNLGAVPAISVHAYAPRLTAMTYYDVAEGGLVTGRTVHYRLGAAIP
jgi:mannose-6-phosphate isomerase-like protein (cupin superfamily)